jgi:hypothetical protein
VSVVVDAFAITPASRFLPAEREKNAFLLYHQPLEQALSCTPLHFVQYTSGKATGNIQGIIDTIFASLAEQGCLIKSVCSDGDNCYNPRYRTFFNRGILLFLKRGLMRLFSFVETPPRSLSQITSISGRVSVRK